MGTPAFAGLLVFLNLLVQVGPGLKALGSRSMPGLLTTNRD